MGSSIPAVPLSRVSARMFMAIPQTGKPSSGTFAKRMEGPLPRPEDKVTSEEPERSNGAFYLVGDS